MRAAAISLALAAMAALAGAAAHAENFTGRVVDTAGNALAGAAVRAAGKGVVAVTDSAGLFRLKLPGKTEARVTVSHVGYGRRNAVLRPRTPAPANTIRLAPAHTSLATVAVTATRTPKPLKDVPVLTRVITEADIAKTDATDIRDLLVEEMPGIEFGFSMSQETSLSMGGMGGNAVLFLIDGERLAGETLDNTDYSRFDLANVGRVEIVKGASSALYGANAVGGVVNLISKEPSGPWSMSLDSRYRHSGNEWRNGGSLNIASGKWTLATTARHTVSNTVRLADAFDTKSDIHEIFGGRTLNIRQRATYKASRGLSLTGRGSYFRRTSNRANHDDRYDGYGGGLGGKWEIGDTHSLELSYGYDQYDKSRHAGNLRTHDHDYSNRQHTAHALYTKAWGKNTLTLGGDYMHDRLSTYQFRDGRDRTQNSLDAFAQFDCSPLEWLNVVASVRDDYFSASGSNALTTRLAVMAKPKPFTVRASYSGGFRAPTLKEMYMEFDMAGIQTIYGNPNLKPERSHNLALALERGGRIGAGALAGAYTITLAGHHNRYERRIATAEYPGGDGKEAGAVYVNESGVGTTGVDAQLRYRARGGMGIAASYSYLHTGGNNLEAQFMPPRPHSATWRVDYNRDMGDNHGLYAGISGRWLSRPAGKTETDGAYSIWKLTLKQRIFKAAEINLTVDNLFGYRPKTYYWNSAPTTGRTWSAGLTVDIDKLM